MAMIDTLIVPGLNGSPPGHWQHHWSESEPSAEIVEQEDWAAPLHSDWLHALEARIVGSEPGVILIAHSLGCSLVASLRGRASASHVGGALLVAPVDVRALGEIHPSIRSFEGAEHTPLPFASIVVASRNDPFLSFAGAERQAARWGSALHDLGEAGHINIASGFGLWPDAATLANGLRGRSVQPQVGGRPAPELWAEAHLRLARAHDGGLGVG